MLDLLNDKSFNEIKENNNNNNEENKHNMDVFSLFEDYFPIKDVNLTVNSPSEATSNSYLYHIIAYFISNVLKCHKTPEILYKQGKNPDFMVNFIINIYMIKTHFKGIFFDLQ